jgi:cephalosporin hydroxylase
MCVETIIKHFVERDCTFQLTHGNSIASMKTPSSGPLVADVISIDDSITPDRVATPNEIPMMRTPYTDPAITINFSYFSAMGSVNVVCS